MINGLLLQCGHKVIISMNKREISKEIIPFFSQKVLHILTYCMKTFYP